MALTVWMLPKFNPTNKYNELLSKSIENKGIVVNDFNPAHNDFFHMKNGDILHFHWIHPYYQHGVIWIMIIKSIKFLSYLILLRLRGIKIVWTVHNLYPHKYRWLYFEKIIRKIIMLLCNKLIVAGQSIKQQVIKEFNVKPEKIDVVMHGNYYKVYPIHYQDYRKKYNIAPGEIVFLFVGAIKEYKGVIDLLKTFTQIKNEKIHLLVAGKVYEGLGKSIKQFTDVQNITFDLRFIPDEELADLIISSTFVVLPYKNITTSGTAILAVSLKRKIITPGTPFMKEYFDKSTSIMYDIEDPEGLIKVLKYCVDHPDSKEISEDDYHKFLDNLSWNQLGEKMKRIYLSL
ncbi:glycosyltransferase [Sporolactobacillus sp. THM7-7]|nr:glycosyltransferase [Sporolactobacillus sp. THM7-7]